MLVQNTAGQNQHYVDQWKPCCDFKFFSRDKFDTKFWKKTGTSINSDVGYWALNKLACLDHTFSISVYPVNCHNSAAHKGGPLTLNYWGSTINSMLISSPFWKSDCLVSLQRFCVELMNYVFFPCTMTIQSPHLWSPYNTRSPWQLSIRQDQPGRKTGRVSSRNWLSCRFSGLTYFGMFRGKPNVSPQFWRIRSFQNTHFVTHLPPCNFLFLWSSVYNAFFNDNVKIWLWSDQVYESKKNLMQSFNYHCHSASATHFSEVIQGCLLMRVSIYPNYFLSTSTCRAGQNIEYRVYIKKTLSPHMDFVRVRNRNKAWICVNKIL